MSSKGDLQQFYCEMEQLSSSSLDSATSSASQPKTLNSKEREVCEKNIAIQSKAHIDRLLRSGSTYFNLNPFEVLQVEPEAELDEIKKKYRRLSMLVHPDKNQQNSERAQKAFDIITKSWKILENDVTRKKCLDIVEEAKGRTKLMLEEKRKKARKEGRTRIAEENPEEYKRSIYVLTMKLFADMERKRRDLDERSQEERKRKREEELEEEERQKVEKEWQKNFEESRENRVTSWKQFKEKSSRKKIKTFKPPQSRPETKLY